MPYTRIFKVPDYYASFKCKCGACKNTCCHGWAITLSMPEYFRLCGIECSPKLRRALDAALLVLDKPTPERYATFNTDWRGGCRLHREPDGLCALQLECGEEVLPAICRMYPRAVHTRYADECCCSAGCEAVAEELMERKSRLCFTELELTVPLEPEQKQKDSVSMLYIPVRERCIEILQIEGYTLEQKLAAVAELAEEAENALASQAQEFDPKPAELYIEKAGRPMEFDVAAAKFLASWFAERSYSLLPYAEEAAEYYGAGCDASLSLPSPELALERLKDAEARRGNFELALENLLVNEVFLSGFPFNSDSPTDATLALQALYLILRYIAAATDGSAYAVFRVVDNTSFYESAPKLMKLLVPTRAHK